MSETLRTVVNFPIRRSSSVLQVETANNRRRFRQSKRASTDTELEQTGMQWHVAPKFKKSLNSTALHFLPYLWRYCSIRTLKV